MELFQRLIDIIVCEMQEDRKKYATSETVIPYRVYHNSEDAPRNFAPRKD